MLCFFVFLLIINSTFEKQVVTMTWSGNTQWVDSDANIIALATALPQSNPATITPLFSYIMNSPPSKSDVEGTGSEVVISFGGSNAQVSGWEAMAASGVSAWESTFLKLKEETGINGIDWDLEILPRSDSSFWSFCGQLSQKLKAHGMTVVFTIMGNIAHSDFPPDTFLQSYTQFADYVVIMLYGATMWQNPSWTTYVDSFYAKYSTLVSEKLILALYPNGYDFNVVNDAVDYVNSGTAVGIAFWCYFGWLGTCSTISEQNNECMKVLNSYGTSQENCIGDDDPDDPEETTLFLPSNPNIRYDGRFDKSNQNSYKFDFGSCTISARFTGSSLKIILNDGGGGNMFDVIIDGEVETITVGSGSHSFTCNSGVHELKIVKRTEALCCGIAKFGGLEVTSLVAFENDERKKMLFFGNSFTAAYGVLGPSKTCPFDKTEQNARLAYPALLASEFNLEYQVVAKSGYGMVRNCNELGQTSSDPLPSYSDEICGNTWGGCGQIDSSDFQPDFISIFLGINDYSYGMDAYHPPLSIFKQGYESFVESLQTKYPNVQKYFFLSFDVGSVWKSALDELAEEYNGEHIDMNILLDSEYGCGWHPNTEGQEKYFETFKQRLSLYLDPTNTCNPVCEYGSCVSGSCVCQDGWEGESCSTPICSPACEIGETCISPDVCQGETNELCHTGEQFDECQVAESLRLNGYGGDVDTMVKIAWYESRWQTRNCHYNDYDGSYDYGLFQINNMYWCSEPGFEENNGCNVDCWELLNSVEKQVKCAEIIRQAQGLTAWAAYNTYQSECDSYELPDCSGKKCFGIFDSSPSVCNGNGICVGTDQCQCNDGYSGLQCQISEGTYCFGIESTDSSVCSSHGVCVTTDICNCNSGFSGEQCELVNQASCNGILATDSSVCNGNGVCLSDEVCSCYTGYYGDYCENSGSISCFGYTQDDTNVCNGHGTCTSQDVCVCFYGYYGDDCSQQETLECFGIQASSLTVCSSHGTCVAKDTCSCYYGYTGTDCSSQSSSSVTCYGIGKYSSGVCSGNGNCVGEDNCNCWWGHQGYDCSEVTTCNGVEITSSDACSGHGTCQTDGTCLCWSGYSGSDCDESTNTGCFGKGTWDIDVCGGHGSCLESGMCSCWWGWTGDECTDEVTCNGVAISDPTACSGKGTCQIDGTCLCWGSYSGVNCENSRRNNDELSEISVKCHGYESSDSEVCGGKGRCDGDDQCTCKQFYKGEDCTKLIARKCFGYDVSHPFVCSGNGECSDTNRCHCDPGFYGTQCQFNSSTSCNSLDNANQNVCSRHGSCTAQGNCNCYLGFYGKDCQNKKSGNCFGKTNKDDDVCSGNGKCVGYNECRCYATYGGSMCEKENHFECYGYNNKDEKVCSGNGECRQEDFCACKEGYKGTRCQFEITPGYTCYGIPSDNESVCSHRGNCYNNECYCEDGFYGNNCENTVTCSYNGLALETFDLNVCCGSGECVDLDTCECDYYHYGANCENESFFLYLLGGIGIIGFSIICILSLAIISVVLFVCIRRKTKRISDDNYFEMKNKY